mmetsp:Transcript_24989/g.75000  ORF Transcript_24989/g.75000 Transcript_24989/m.75000 type:complete len:198 (+) Transcript_24989:537-1130(+)
MALWIACLLALAVDGALVGRRVTYFAFGSNMHPAVLRGRRGIEPFSQTAAKAPGWRLGFSIRGGGAEPSFASAELDARRTLYGICYELSPADWAKVQLTEGVPVGYVPVPIRCLPVDAPGDPIWAFTLSATPGPGRINNIDDEPVPSERYLGYLRRGARHGRLPTEWIEYLDALSRDPTAEIPMSDADREWEARVVT